jgi:hypothetical protein
MLPSSPSSPSRDSALYALIGAARGAHLQVACHAVRIALKYRIASFAVKMIDCPGSSTNLWNELRSVVQRPNLQQRQGNDPDCGSKIKVPLLRR